jgi:hypothetical protein
MSGLALSPHGLNRPELSNGVEPGEREQSAVHARAVAVLGSWERTAADDPSVRPSASKGRSSSVSSRSLNQTPTRKSMGPEPNRSERCGKWRYS